MRIIYVINSLDIGGAEFSLLKLVDKLKANNELIVVALLSSTSVISTKLERGGIRVISLGLSHKNIVVKCIELVKLFRSERPEVVHTWLYISDLIGGVCAKLAGVPRVYWGIHNTYLGRDKVPWSTRFVVNLNSMLSHLIPDKVISCSHAAIDVHRSKGYSRDKFVFIPNGVNVDEELSNDHDNKEITSELGIKKDDFVIGYVARYDVLKNHRGFLQSCHKLLRFDLERNFKVLLVGDGLTNENEEVVELLIEYGLRDNVVLLGYRSDVSRIINILDLAVLFSWGEAFPNVIIESMMYGKPFLASNVGDCQYIIGDGGSIVESGDTQDLANHMRNYMKMDNDTIEELGMRARNRVLTHFTMDIVAENHLDCYSA
jgi:glycosyltransferase involved in cell wall biosynthesis